MRSADFMGRTALRRAMAVGLVGLMSACGQRQPAPPPDRPVPSELPRPGGHAEAARPNKPASCATQAHAVRSLDALRLHVARCVVEANPEQAYLSQPPAVLLAVPVFKLELHADGRVKRIDLLREPGQAKDTVQLARKAIERAAPFGDLRRVPGPLVFTETYLFDDARRFKPRSLN